MWKSRCNFYHRSKVPLVFRRFDVSPTSPVDGYGRLSIVPDVALVLTCGILGPDGQTGSSCNGNLGFCGSFHSGDLGLIADFYTDYSAEFSTFSEPTDETVPEDVGELLVIQLIDWVEGHLVSDGCGFVGHFDSYDVIQIGLVDFVLVDHRGTSSALDGSVFDGCRRGNVQGFYDVGHVVDHARRVSDNLDDILARWRGLCWLDRRRWCVTGV